MSNRKANRERRKANNLDIDSRQLAKISGNVLLKIERDKLIGAHHKKIYADRQHHVDKFTLLPTLNRAGDKIVIVGKHKDY